jgi:hypothetical protein
MKLLVKRAFKSLLTIALFCAIGTAISLPQTKQANASIKIDCGNITDQQITTYLAGYGYVVSSVATIPGSCDRLCTTQYCYKTKVHIVSGAIVGFEDMPGICD